MVVGHIITYYCEGLGLATEVCKTCKYLDLWIFPEVALNCFWQKWGQFSTKVMYKIRSILIKFCFNEAVPSPCTLRVPFVVQILASDVNSCKLTIFHTKSPFFHSADMISPFSERFKQFIVIHSTLGQSPHCCCQQLSWWCGHMQQKLIWFLKFLSSKII